MKFTRRSLIAALFGSLAAKVMPKPSGGRSAFSFDLLTPSVDLVTRGWSDSAPLVAGDTISITEYWPRNNDRLFLNQADDYIV